MSPFIYFVFKKRTQRNENEQKWWNTKKKIKTKKHKFKGADQRFGNSECWCCGILSCFQCDGFDCQCRECSSFDKIACSNNITKYNGHTTFAWNPEWTYDHFRKYASKWRLHCTQIIFNVKIDVVLFEHPFINRGKVCCLSIKFSCFASYKLSFSLFSSTVEFIILMTQLNFCFYQFLLSHLFHDDLGDTPQRYNY